MLTSLLPGLRDVRTPLAAGYIWLLAGWFAFGDLFPHEKPTLADPAFAGLFDLASFLGKASVLAALTFTAYLVGAFLSIDPQGVAARLLVRGFGLRFVSPAMAKSLTEFVKTQVASALTGAGRGNTRSGSGEPR